MKRKPIIVMFLLSIILLTACSKDYEEDYTTTRKDLLDESLGNWNVVNHSEAEVMYKPIYVSKRTYNKWKVRYGTDDEKPLFVPTHTFLKWTIEYKDNKGDKYEFFLDNMGVLEEDLTYELFEKLTTDFRKEVSEDIYVSVEDPYLEVPNLEGEYFSDNYDTIKELYGDSFSLNKSTLENAFEGTPIHVIIKFDKENFPNLSDSEFNKHIDDEMNRLLSKIPKLNAYISIINDNNDKKFTAKHFIQGNEVETNPIYVSEFHYKNELKKHFKEFDVLEPKKKYISD